MRLLTYYLMRTILSGTLLVLTVLLALNGLFEFIGQLEDTQGAYGVPQALLYATLRLPQMSFEMLPMSALIGSLLGLGSLASSSELVVMRASGISVLRLAGMVATSGVVLMIFTGFIAEYIGPPLDHFARDMRNEARYEKGGDSVGNPAWVKDGPVILHLERVNTEFEFGSLFVFRFNEDNTLQSIAQAENSGIDDDDNWVLENFRETRFVNDSVQVVESSLAVESFEVDAELLGFTLVKPISLSLRGLLSYIDYLKKNNLTAERWESEFWSRIASTFTMVIMPVLALGFVFGSLRSAGAGGRLMIGVLIGLAYFLGTKMLDNSGQVFDLNPALLMWVPSVALLLVTILTLSRVR